MLDFSLVVLVDVFDVLDVVETHVGRHAQHLVVATGLVNHVVQTHGAALNHAAGEHGVRNHHESVQRIAVLAQGAIDVAVVIRVAHCGEQGAIQEHAAGLVVDFVLVLGAARNFHNDVEGFCHWLSPCLETIRYTHYYWAGTPAIAVPAFRFTARTGYGPRPPMGRARRSCPSPTGIHDR